MSGLAAARGLGMPRRAAPIGGMRMAKVVKEAKGAAAAVLEGARAQEQMEWRKGRPFEFIVAEDLFANFVVHGDELHFIQI